MRVLRGTLFVLALAAGCGDDAPRGEVDLSMAGTGDLAESGVDLAPATTPDLTDPPSPDLLPPADLSTPPGVITEVPARIGSGGPASPQLDLCVGGGDVAGDVASATGERLAVGFCALLTY